MRNLPVVGKKLSLSLFSCQKTGIEPYIAEKQREGFKRLLTSLSSSYISHILMEARQAEYSPCALGISALRDMRPPFGGLKSFADLVKILQFKKNI